MFFLYVKRKSQMTYGRRAYSSVETAVDDIFSRATAHTRYAARGRTENGQQSQHERALTF